MWLWIPFIASALAQPAAELPEITVAWTVEVVALKRWPDADTQIGQSRMGEKVEILSREGELVRIRRGVEFGWLPESALTLEDPAGDDTDDAESTTIKLGSGPPTL